MSPLPDLRLAILGTDTDVGKTWVTGALIQGLRALGQRVWVHKPVACGEWDGASAADGRTLRGWCGDGQDPVTVCPHEFPEACSPHLAAALAGVHLGLTDLVQAVPQPPVATHLVLETAGGLLAPLTEDRLTNADLVAALGWSALVVTRPHLGTLNHTQLTVNEARRRGIRVLGLVVNHHSPATGHAVETAPAELAALTGLPVLAVMRQGDQGGAALAAALLALHTKPS